MILFYRGDENFVLQAIQFGERLKLILTDKDAIIRNIRRDDCRQSSLHCFPIKTYDKIEKACGSIL
jgi:hypothetical protein